MRILALSAALALAGCREPTPDPSPLPEPQAAQPAATELRDAMQAPIDKAHAVEDTQRSEEADRQQALKDAGG